MVIERTASLAATVAQTSWAGLKVARRSHLLAPTRPDRMVRAVRAFRQWGGTAAGVIASNAARVPDQLAVIDERESLTYAELDRRSSIIAAGLRERGIGAGDRLALLARNSSAFLLAQLAAAKVGADVLYLNTGFAGPQLGDVLTSERASILVADDEFKPLAEHVPDTIPWLTAWVAAGDAPADSLAGLVEAAGDGPAPELPSPEAEGRHIILTSGTTGRPKGAARGSPNALSGAVSGLALLDMIPYPGRGVTVLAAPAFHAWGLGNIVIGSMMQATFVMARRFDPAETLKLVERYHADTLVAVPVMCQRMLDVAGDFDTSSLKVVALSGSALAPTLATRFMDRFGDVLYSLYGSTEIAYVSVATPRDLRAAPTTAGKVLRGVTVRLVDADDNDVAPGQVGRIFAGSSMSFEGYTSGEDKARLGTLASIGDLGRIGDDGRLYVEGRDDDMIISGGENVFPAEVEDVLHQHSAVADVTVVGVADDRFGQALVAHVVLRDGETVTGDDLRTHVKQRLATYKVPREIVFHDALPRNETGKVLKRLLS
ncbi:MAG TPA: AMP-binding protein [Mycobacteriales bacterium]|nr:AMP-binding protein [Mycobacteriales bacterium]